jgi:DeoR/GlpR family transcriptional regulator of sugar metabolism
MSLAMHQQLLILITVVVRLQNENNVIIHNHICFVFHSLSMKGKTKKNYHNVGTFQKSNSKIIERVKMDTLSTLIRDKAFNHVCSFNLDANFTFI